MNRLRTCTVLMLLASFSIAQEASDAALTTDAIRPIAFDKIDRSIGRLPVLLAAQPLYGLFLFGTNGERRVWAVLDKSNRDAVAYDVLYLDRNANGDLTEAGERIAGVVGATGVNKENANAKFDIGEFRDPGSDAVHQAFQLTWTEASVRFKMLWRGERVTMGVYGPYRETYQNFGPSRSEAPIMVPGYDRPFEFEHWMCDHLKRGGSTDFKVFVGNRGDRTGAFACVDQEFLPDTEYVQATLIYRDAAGKQQRVLKKLTERC